MPELPDVTVYVERIEAKTKNEKIERVRIASPFVVRSVDPPLYEVEGKTVREVRRIGKRIAIGLDDELWIVIHLMIAGRFRWLKAGAKIPGRLGLAAFDFANGSLILTEAGTQRRASITVVRGEDNLAQFDRGGAEPLEIDEEVFAERQGREPHTEAILYRSHDLQRNRKRVLRRDLPSGAHLSDQAHITPDLGRDHSALHGNA